MTLQQLNVCNAARVESGPVQMNVQPPGFYLAGEDARFLALDIAVLLGFVRGSRGVNANALQAAIHHLELLHDQIRETIAQ